MEGLSAVLYKPSSNLDVNNIESYKSYIASLPTSAFILLIASYAISSFLGAYVAARISITHKVLSGIIVGSSLLIASISNFKALPHPTWVIICSCLSFIVFSILGAKLASVLQKN